ncbi:hypothetical protein LCGC14_0837580 [marine sediment metagenome]|uniref:Nuclease associated modular domain-containing protein n=1 Tax=marine sediment metagenome TaxID=412755 RepID=A0A0F9RYR6_9ZZZZ
MRAKWNGEGAPIVTTTSVPLLRVCGEMAETVAVLETTPALGEERLVGRTRRRWVACPICDKERWVRLEQGAPRSKVCRKCCSPDTREKMSRSGKGRIVSAETRRKISQARMGHIGYMTGMHHTDEAKLKMRQARLGKHLTEETKEKLRRANLGRVVPARPPITQETRERLRQSHLGRRVSEATRAKRRVISRRLWLRPEYREKVLASLHGPLARRKTALTRIGNSVSVRTREKISASLMGHTFSDATIQKMSRTQKRLWSTPEHRDMVRKAMRLGMQVSPNKPETALQGLLDTLYPCEWEFVGDGKLVVAGKNPDFMRVGDRRQLMELFGDYWHRGENPDDRIELFTEHGYTTLVIWEKELSDVTSLVERIVEFAT